MRTPMRSRAKRLALLPAFVRYLRDGRASTLGKLFLVATAVYVVCPLDAIPDVAPIVGWLDDLGLATIALLYLSRALAPYREAPQLA